MENEKKWTIISIMKKIKMIDLFCGAGIGAVGFKDAGFEIVHAIDSSKHAVRTYRKNIGDHVVCEDIRDTEVDSIPEADIIVGGFPCQSFSFSGKSLGEKDEKNGDLADYFFKVISMKRPKVFMLENVKGIASKKHKEFFDLLLKSFEEEGYVLTKEVVNCLDYGLPQKRQRVFVVGVREDLNKVFSFPDKVDGHKTIRDVIGDLPEPIDYSVAKNDKSCLRNHYGVGIRKDEMKFIDKVPTGGNWKDIPEDDQKVFLGKSFYSGGGKTGYLRKMSFDSYALTITSTIDGKFNAQIIDNKDKYGKIIKGIPKSRRYTVRECLRIQTVPDWFAFDDDIPLRKQYEGCGNGIPSEMTKILGCAIIEQIFKS